MYKGDDIEERLIDFAVRIILVCDNLEKSQTSAKHIRNQLVRSGTSPAPNYGEARSAESPKDFVHKLKIVLKELNETQIWLKIVVRAKLIKGSLLDDLLDECNQLCRIINSSITTSKRKIVESQIEN